MYNVVLFSGVQQSDSVICLCVCVCVCVCVYGKRIGFFLYRLLLNIE